MNDMQECSKDLTRKNCDFKGMNANIFLTRPSSYNQNALFKFTEIPSSPQKQPTVYSVSLCLVSYSE